MGEYHTYSKELAYADQIRKVLSSLNVNLNKKINDFS
jgi:hypothetical protein